MFIVSIAVASQLRQTLTGQELPHEFWVQCDLGRLIAHPRYNIKSLDWADEFDLRLYRQTIESVNSQLEKLGVQRLYALTNPDFMLKVFASIITLACSNLN